MSSTPPLKQRTACFALVCTVCMHVNMMSACLRGSVTRCASFSNPSTAHALSLLCVEQNSPPPVPSRANSPTEHAKVCTIACPCLSTWGQGRGNMDAHTHILAQADRQTGRQAGTLSHAFTFTASMCKQVMPMDSGQTATEMRTIRDTADAMDAPQHGPHLPDTKANNDPFPAESSSNISSSTTTATASAASTSGAASANTTNASSCRALVPVQEEGNENDDSEDTPLVELSLSDEDRQVRFLFCVCLCVCVFEMHIITHNRTRTRSCPFAHAHTYAHLIPAHPQPP